MAKAISLAIVIAFLIETPHLLGQTDEKRDYYFRWLDRDVVYIISDDERAVFKKLTTPEEKDAFIEQFWRRRDLNRNTAENEFKEEHYRRIAYANDHFKSGINGWETDRGRIYIMYGTPTSLESFPAGGTYERRPGEGGGTTATYAFERWYYREIPGVGSGIELEFVDPTQTGEFRLAMRPSEKDALWQTGGGKTMVEILGLATRLGVMRSDEMMRNFGLEGEPSYMAAAQPFIKLQQYFQATRPPEVQFNDLREAVEARVTYHTLPCDLSFEIFRVTNDAVLVPATVSVPSAALTYKEDTESVARATISIYGRVETLTRATVYEFEDSISSEVSTEELRKGISGATIYQRQLPLRPGNYKVTVVVKDVNSEKISSLVSGVQIPTVPEGSLSTSSIVLANAILSSSPGDDVTKPFIVPSGFKIYPNLKREFDSKAMLYFYAEIYNAKIDQQSRRPHVNVEIQLLKQGQVEQAWAPRLLVLRDRVAVFHHIDLQSLERGPRLIKLRIRDAVSGLQLDRTAEFRIAGRETRP